MKQRSEAETVVAHLRKLSSDFNRRKISSYYTKGRGGFRHARERGHPVYSVRKFLDSCLRRNDGLYHRKFLNCSNI